MPAPDSEAIAFDLSGEGASEGVVQIWYRGDLVGELRRAPGDAGVDLVMGDIDPELARRFEVRWDGQPFALRVRFEPSGSGQ